MRPAYERPGLRDYGTLLELTADLPTMTHLGIGTMAVVTAPLSPGAGAGGGTAGVNETSPGGAGGEGVLGGNGEGGVGGVNAEGSEGGSGGGAGGGSGGGGTGGGSGGGSGGGGGGGDLPFTGFPVAVAGAVGAGLTAAGEKLRRSLRSRD